MEGRIYKNFELTIIIVNYKSTQLVQECLDSLKKQDYPGFQVIIVDNTEGNGDLPRLNAFPNKYKKNFLIQILKPKYNLGFAGGNNFAIKKIPSLYYLLLNSDIELDPNTLTESILYLKSHPNVGMLSPKIVYFSNWNRLWYAGAIINPKKIQFCFHRGIDQIDDGSYEKIETTDYACGACLFVKEDVVKKIGLLDEIFFLYSEETDWNMRAKANGFEIIYFPKVKVYHKVQPLLKKSQYYFAPQFQLYLGLRNQIIMMVKNASFSELFHYFTKNFFINSILDIKFFFKKQDTKFLLSRTRARIMGLIIGFKRRTNRSCRQLLIMEHYYFKKFKKISRSTQK